MDEYLGFLATNSLPYTRYGFQTNCSPYKQLMAIVAGLRINKITKKIKYLIE